MSKNLKTTKNRKNCEQQGLIFLSNVFGSQYYSKNLNQADMQIGI